MSLCSELHNERKRVRVHYDMERKNNIRESALLSEVRMAVCVDERIRQICQPPMRFGEL